MATVTVLRQVSQDAFGDPLGESEHSESGAKIGWNNVTQVNESNGHVVQLTDRKVTLYFKRRVPDILDTDRVRLPDGRVFAVEGVNPWEHARHDGVIAGVEVVLSGVV